MSYTQELKISVPEGKKVVYDETTQTIKFVDVDTPKQEFEYVDLGLPSGTLWATRNIGAEKDTDFGDYFNFESSQKYNCPSKEQIDELVHNTTSLWITKEGVNGRLFIGKNGNHIFMPAAGNRYGGLYFEGSKGYYWSSTHGSGSAYLAYDLYFDSGNVDTDGNIHRYYWFPVRTVSK